MADFQMALSAVTFMSELDEDAPISRVERRRHRCYEDAAVIAYARPFTTTNGLPTLSFNHLGLKPTPEQKSLHQRIIERRNKVVAHSDADRQRISFAAFKVFDDRDIMMPHFDFDDALTFFGDRLRWMDWLRHLMAAGTRILFEMVQGQEPIRFLRDHSLNADIGAGETET